jgi:peptidoglycan-associated lipoprotein
MGTTKSFSKQLSIFAVLGTAGVASACSTVSPEEMDTGLASLRDEIRQEIQAGDEQVSQELGGRIDTVEERLAALEQDLQRMEEEYQVMVERLEDQLRFNVPVYFGFDDATVQGEGPEILDRFAAVRQEYYPQAIVTVEGFTDPSGPEAYNETLGQRRADAVREYLIGTAGFAEGQIKAVSYGENTERLVMPEEWGPGQEGWQNRRVVLVIDHDGTAPVISVDGSR